MELAFSIGISISEFWELTPYELIIAQRGFYKRKEYEAEEYEAKMKNQRVLMTIQAYQISRWVWAKKLDIKEILKDMEGPAKKQMTNEQMLAQVKMLNALFGGEVVEGDVQR